MPGHRDGCSARSGRRDGLSCIAGLILCVAAHAGAAASSPPPVSGLMHQPIMHMAVVRSNDPSCAQRCSDWIAMDGPIGVGSAGRFARLLKTLGNRRLPILVSSNGGSVQDAMAMGRLIRKRHLDVAVSKTAFTSCPADRLACESLVPDGLVTGAPVTAGSFCASSCSLVLAAGERRFVALRTYVGVHQFRSFRKLTKVMRTFRIVTRKVDGVAVEVSRTLVSERPLSTSQIAVQTSPATYEEAQRYFASMGIAPNLMALAETTTPDSIHWLTLAELFSTRMDTEGKDGAYLIAHASPDAPTAAPAQPQAAPSPEVRHAAADDATLISEDADDRKPVQLTGPAVWAIDQSQPVPTLQALVDLSDRAGSLKVSIQDLGPVGRPAYHIALTLMPGPDSPYRSVVAVGLPAIRVVPDQPPVDLQATVGPLVSGTVGVELATGTAGWTNQRLMSRGEGLEFPLVVLPLRRLRIKLPFGPSERDAFTRWRTLVDSRPLAG